LKEAKLKGKACFARGVVLAFLWRITKVDIHAANAVILL